MKSAKAFLKEILTKLDELIKTAQELKDKSQQVLSENEIYHLQEKQERLLHEITHLDHQLEPFYKSEVSEADHNTIHQKVEEFKKLNNFFINNLTSKQGVIQFESLKEMEEEGDIIKPFHFNIPRKEEAKDKKKK